MQNLTKMNMLFGEVFDINIDKLLCPEIPVLPKSWPVFQICGYVGLALAILLSMTLVTHLGLSLWVMAGLVLIAVVTFLALAMVTKIITGKENLIYYHHEISVMVVAAWLLKVLHQPILSYLDITILGIGTFLVCGRVGCLMVGCCHGRPHGWGVCYREEHATAGFTPYLVGVRLFPIQAVESVWVFSIVVVGSVLVLSGHQPGTTLSWYVIAYGMGRFFFEFMRGDPDRPYYSDLSQAQWISLILVGLVALAEMSGILPFHPWHIGANVCLLLAVIGITLKRRLQKTAKHHLLHPRHLRDVAEIIKSAFESTDGYEETGSSKRIRVAQTSLGVKISAGTIYARQDTIPHYTLSYEKQFMTTGSAKILEELIIQLKHPSSSRELMKGNHGTFHVLVRDEKESVRATNNTESKIR